MTVPVLVIHRRTIANRSGRGLKGGPSARRVPPSLVPHLGDAKSYAVEAHSVSVLSQALKEPRLHRALVHLAEDGPE
jgi:hypothetical protein